MELVRTGKKLTPVRQKEAYASLRPLMRDLVDDVRTRIQKAEYVYIPELRVV